MPIAPADISKYNRQALITLTYDDGRKNNFDVVLPLHVEFNMQAGFGVIAERALDPRHWEHYMDARQVAEASRQGVEICSHSYTHTRLTEVDAARLDFELKESQRVLNGLIRGRQEKITSLCIPFSAANPYVLAAAQKYYSCIRVRGDKFTPILPKERETIAYSFGMAFDTTFNDIKTLIDRAVLEKAWITLMLHGVVPAAENVARKNDVIESTLRQVISYVKDIGPENILPINLSDVQTVKSRLRAP